MTTIVADHEGMAADTRVTGGGSFWHAPKIFRVQDRDGRESLFGTAGDGFMTLIMVEWLRTKERDRAKLYENWTEHTDRDDVTLIELNPDGLFIWSAWGVPEKLLDTVMAIGSGGPAALAAYQSGQSLEKSVLQAIRQDEYTGEPVQVEFLVPPELQPKKRKARR